MMLALTKSAEKPNQKMRSLRSVLVTKSELWTSPEKRAHLETSKDESIETKRNEMKQANW